MEKQLSCGVRLTDADDVSAERVRSLVSCSGLAQQSSHLIVGAGLLQRPTTPVPIFIWMLNMPFGLSLAGLQPKSAEHRRTLG